MRWVHPPEESEIDINQKFLVGDKKLSWERKKYIDGEIHSIPSQMRMPYFCTVTFILLQTRKVTFSLGSDDAIKVWANELEIFSKDDSRGSSRQDQVVVSLKEGQNKFT